MNSQGNPSSNEQGFNINNAISEMLNNGYSITFLLGDDEYNALSVLEKVLYEAKIMSEYMRYIGSTCPDLSAYRAL